MGNIKIINRVFPVILFHVLLELPSTTFPLEKKNLLRLSITYRQKSPSPLKIISFSSHFSNPSKKSFASNLSLQNFFPTSRSHTFWKSIEPVLIPLGGKISIFREREKKKERKRRKVKATKNRLSLGLTFSSFVRACRCGSMERETPGDIYNTGSDSWQTRVHHTGRIFLYVSARTVSTCRARARCSRCPSHRMRSADKGYRAMRGKLIPSATGRSCALSRSRIRPNMCTPAARDASRFGI